MKDVLLGYEVGTGNPVSVPLRNLAVTGQTQESGKTTTLEALATRSGAKVITFVTKRGEGSFVNARRVQPYFRDRADWQFVDAILEAALGEKNKFLRQFLIPICRHTKTLADVQAAVRDGLKKARGVKEGAFVQLDAYLELIVPAIRRAKLAPSLDLITGLNVMDVSEFDTPMQMLFVQSALDWVNERERDTIVVIPEAWEFIPEGKGSPAKSSAITLVRKGSGIGNRIWVDSQDMAGVDKTILRGCPVWLIGVQREINEIKRNIANIPPPTGKPKPADVAMLERGQFFVCFGTTLAKVYVRPSWMSEDEARAIAMGGTQKSTPPQPAKEPEVTDAEARELRDENARLRQQMSEAVARQVVADPEAIETALSSGFSDGRSSGWDAGYRAGFRKGHESGVVAVKVLVDNIGEVVDQSVPPDPLADAPAPAVVPFKAPTPAPKVEAPQPKPVRAATPARGADTSMLDPLVRSHPESLTAELWGLFLGLSAGTTKSGPWHTKVRALVEAGLIEKTSGGFRATAEGIAASSESPANPQTSVQLWALWREKIAAIVGEGAMGLLRLLALHRNHVLTNEQLALLAGKGAGTARSGPWFTMINTLREWDLIDGVRAFLITAKGMAIVPDGDKPPASNTAEMLRQARYARLEMSKRHYDALTRPMTKKELGESLGMSEGTMKSGPWHSAIKEMVESGLVRAVDGVLTPVKEELA